MHGLKWPINSTRIVRGPSSPAPPPEAAEAEAAEAEAAVAAAACPFAITK